ncbi:Ig-like domain-containing protein [Leifsonia aquatica]|uniref:Bacterial Ig domain-containing protein n=2 Tax=Leifsonia aquatica TaxID=144185 RepID=U2TDU3_LEIAQ|nr:Ig-like domain-containing protein [Leifsonia aquatica]ERK72867.1 hypothetical protein N136_00782 [Leifsonia aquatica ATCC 14665]MBB2969187.1 hypothetical protein [Leifsonia aquatica]
MNRFLRTFLISATVAVGAVVTIPAAASAAPIEDRAAGESRILKPPASSTVAPGQVYSMTVYDAATLEATVGETVQLVALPLRLVPGQSVCGSGIQIGEGPIRPDGTIEITATGTVEDGQTVIYFCHPRVGGGGYIYTMDNPFELRSPGADEGLPVDRAVVTGVGSPGAQVDARTADGSPVGSAVVGQDGTWSVTLSDLAQGPTTITFTQGSKSFDADFTIVSESESTPLVDPVSGGALGASALALGLGVLVLRRRRTRTAV